MSSEYTAGQPLLVVIAPTARRVDPESVRIAKDVLCGGAAVKVAMPEGPAELDRVLAHRGRKRPVVIGDDRALQLVVQTLYRQRELGAGAVGLIPVGGPATMALARALGIPTEPVAAARAVLAGHERSLDLLVDDSGGVVLGELCIPGRAATSEGARDGGARDGAAGAGDAAADRSGGGSATGRVGFREARGGVDDPNGGETCSLSAKQPAAGQGTALGSADSSWWSLAPAVLRRTARSVVRAVRPGAAAPSDGHGPGHRLRVEVDGALVADVDRPVRLVAVRLAAVESARPGAAGAGEPVDGAAEVLVRPPTASGRTLRVRARTVTVAGRDFSYEADSELTGPVRSRTWTVRPAAWRLTVPAASAG
ncbi:hypothetical protein ACIQGZ_00555 [Streptomyces sp. NPDC092296]|uniref:hypothetical protein n=1 Tax=Streptomyces sp. NPDC092296 TaxID=3366012 RepID=UPI0037F66F19